MANDNLLSTLEQGLRQTRGARGRLAARLAEIESEADSIRAELTELDTIAAQTEAAIYRLLSSVLNRQGSQSASDAEIEAAMRNDGARSGYEHRPMPHPRRVIPAVRSNLEAKSDRFIDRTIPQAATMLLREAGAPLHVNEIYNRLMEGGFNFTGHNPTISIAVSLNRNGRFRKVAPGTFDLVMRDASQAS
jgi:hypothetical protein